MGDAVHSSAKFPSTRTEGFVKYEARWSPFLLERTTAMPDLQKVGKHLVRPSNPVQPHSP